MNARAYIPRWIPCLVLLLAALAGCGQGGTEIGNPQLPHGGNSPASAPEAPGDAAPSLEGATPTPSPQSLFLRENETTDQDITDNPDAPEDDAEGRYGMQEEELP